MRFTQWAHTSTYVTEGPEITFYEPNIVGLTTIQDHGIAPTSIDNMEQPLYSLVSVAAAQSICDNFGLLVFDFPSCPAIINKKGKLIRDFLDQKGIKYPSPTLVHWPRKNTGRREDYN